MDGTSDPTNGHTNDHTNGTSKPSAAVDHDNLFIPLIDFSSFLTPSTPPHLRHATALSILTAFRTSGFIYLSNHGISLPKISHTFSLSSRFFARPQSQKDNLAWSTPRANRGYSGMGREKVSQGSDITIVDKVREEEGQDLKESFEIGNERDGEVDSELRNRWPGEDGGEGDDEDAQVFRQEMLDFFDTCKELHVQVMRALALGLGISEHWFDSHTRNGDCTLRLLHYPPTPKSVFKQKKGQVRAGAHSDYGSITLLFQDKRGGLQVKSPDGTFVDARPIEGTIVVNAGDLLARWSNDYVMSTVHRVVEPPAPEEGDEHPARYSIAYFCNPDYDKLIDVIPGTMKEGEARKYEAVNSGEYLVKRLAATY